jgi:transcriptional regulator with XRE-family HTH domain
MGTDHATTFGEMLRRHRVATGLTQEALAERAGLSVRTVSDLERGINLTPRKDTFHLLADALGLSAEERRRLEAAARHQEGPPVLLLAEETGTRAAEYQQGREAMTGDRAPFGTLLKHYRTGAALSQQALAERAGLSVDAISALEAGRRGGVRLETARRLAEALALTGEDRALFLATARGGNRSPRASRGHPSVRRATPSPRPRPRHRPRLRRSGTYCPAGAAH